MFDWALCHVVNNSVGHGGLTVARESEVQTQIVATFVFYFFCGVPLSDFRNSLIDVFTYSICTYSSRNKSLKHDARNEI
jgi:hypothetical protein